MTDFLFGLASGPAEETARQFHIHQPHVLWLENTPFAISNMVVTQWAIMAVLIVIAVLVNRAVIHGRFTKLRGTLELLVDFLEGWYGSFIGSRQAARRFMPLLGSLFLFILVSNYSGIIPSAGYGWSIFAPTGRWGTTAALAIVVAVASQYVAAKEMGFGGWIKHLLHLGPLSVLEEFVRPFSLSLRLFGNIFGEETLLAVIIFLVPYVAPLPIMGLSLLFGAIQAVVFTTLTSIYIGGILEAHAAHGHGSGHGHGEKGHPEVAHAH